MAAIWRWINGQLVEAGSPEDIAERQKDARVIVDPEIGKEQRRLEDRDKYIEEIQRAVDNSIKVAESQVAQFQKLIDDYSTYDKYYRLKVSGDHADDPTTIWSSIHGPTEDEWRETLTELHVGLTQSADWGESQKLAKQALAESGPAEGGDRLSSAILNLARKHEVLAQEHSARNQALWGLYGRLKADPYNTALQEVYGTKRAEFEMEEIEIKLLAQAKEFLSQKRADQQYLFQA